MQKNWIEGVSLINKGKYIMTTSTMVNNLVTEIELNSFTQRQLKAMLLAAISKMDMIQIDEILTEVDMTLADFNELL